MLKQSFAHKIRTVGQYQDNEDIPLNVKRQIIIHSINKALALDANLVPNVATILAESDLIEKFLNMSETIQALFEVSKKIFVFFCFVCEKQISRKKFKSSLVFFFYCCSINDILWQHSINILVFQID